MRIAYRRMSGSIGFTSHELGTRGLWLEKRNALVAALEARGHRVDFINRMTKFSQLAEQVEFGPATHDYLFIEFGGSNESFYGKDLEKTRSMVATHRGPVVFLCDDPDLPYQWKTVENPARWTAWMNATQAVPFGGQPPSVKCYDAPFASLLEATQSIDQYDQTLVYIGRPNGRKKAFRDVASSGVALAVYGREIEWTEFPGVRVQPSPTQAERKAFYATAMGSLVVADAKHKKLGWRTGRAYHALYAGCPAVAEADHPAMQVVEQYSSPEELLEVANRWLDPARRRRDWERAIGKAKQDLSIMEETFRAHGL